MLKDDTTRDGVWAAILSEASSVLVTSEPDPGVVALDEKLLVGPFFVSSSLSLPNFLPSLLQNTLLAVARKVLQQQPLEMAEDPLKWWSKQALLAPLFPYVRMVLGVPASNTSAERLFSSSGYLSEGRSTLQIETLEQLVVVRHFLLTVEYEGEREHLIQAMMQKLDAIGPFPEEEDVIF